MKLMLDTNICIYLIKQKHLGVIKEFNKFDVGDIGVSSITVAELYYGAAKSKHKRKNQMALTKFLTPLLIAEFNFQSAVEYGKIRALLESQGTPIGALDLLIGAHALSEQVTLVTNNVKEFIRIPNLSIDNWVGK